MVPHKQVRDNGLEQRLKLEAMRADTACHRAAPPASAVRVNLECFFLFYFASDSLWSPAPASQYMIVHRERQLANLRASDLSPKLAFDIGAFEQTFENRFRARGRERTRICHTFFEHFVSI